jgi:acyl-CoA reductase-like NAD-dependent aldehyde dehydrogenase
MSVNHGRTRVAEAGPGRAGRTALIVTSPATGEALERIEPATPEAVRATAERLRAAQPAWELQGPAGRAAALGKLRDWMLDNEDGILDLYQRETAKPRQEALLELMTGVDVINFYARNASRFLEPSNPKPHSLLTRAKKLHLFARPYPVAGVIAPWNFPLALVLLDIVPALVAGCAVMLKPSEVNPLAIRELARAWSSELELPPVFETVIGDAATGEAVVDDSDIVQFTGSSRTGRLVMERAARTLTPVNLELGGKDAMIVLADADLDRAVYGAAWGSMFNSGQRWRLSFDGESISLSPSIGNWNFPCESHYWITASQVRWAPAMTRREIQRVRAAARERNGNQKRPELTAAPERNGAGNDARGRRLLRKLFGRVRR